MQKAKRTIYKLTGESFEIKCEEKHIIQIMNEIMNQKMEEDPDMEYCKFGDPQSNNYIIFSLKMLEQQKNDAEKQKKVNDVKDEKINELEKKYKDLSESKEALNCSIQLKTDRDAINIQSQEIDNLQKSKLELETKNEKLQIDLKNEQKDKKDLEKKLQEERISKFYLKEESKSISEELKIKSEKLEQIEQSKSISIQDNKLQLQQLQQLQYQCKIQDMIQNKSNNQVKPANLQKSSFEISNSSESCNEYDSKFPNYINGKLIEYNLQPQSDDFNYSDIIHNLQIISQHNQYKFERLQKQNDEPFLSYLYKCEQLNLQLKVKLVHKNKQLIQDSIKEVIVDNFLFKNMMKQYFQDNQNIDPQELNIEFQNLGVLKQYILESNDGNCFYCEEFLPGLNQIYAVKENDQSTLNNNINNLFTYCYLKTKKKRIFTQFSLNQNKISNIIGHQSLFPHPILSNELAVFQILQLYVNLCKGNCENQQEF